MILKNGRFYEDGKEVPMEVGNKEQIRLMNTSNNNLKKLQAIERIKDAIKLEFNLLQSLQGQVLFINSIRETLHGVSPFKNEPVDFVKWVPCDQVVANDYNPNSVAPPEMQLLEVSIVNDGYTQPIVTWPQGDKIEVIDGFHRNRVGKESKEVAARIQGYLPTVIIKKEREGKNDRIASTIRHNRARGKHESLNRFRTICTFQKETFKGKRFTTGITPNVFNVYPIYDWRTRDIWVYHAKFKDKEHNKIYDLMNKAGVPLSQQRLCQPYGHDQRKGLWLYHILEPKTWYKLLCRVNGVNSGALYIQENGNITGQNKIYKPKNHTWESFTKLVFATMPKVTRDHYAQRFKVFINGWKGRGYDTIPDEAPLVLENAHWAPSWRRMCKVLLRNDWWCKGLGMQQPLSEAYGKYLDIRKLKKQKHALETSSSND